jgi:copper resistance protein B
MKRALMVLLATTMASPALAQHEGHAPTPVQGAEPGEEEAPADPHAGHAMPASEAPPESASADPHAGHVMPPAEPAGQQPPDDVHAGHAASEQAAPAAQAADPHAGHNMAPAELAPAPADPHAGHGAETAQTLVNPPAGPPPPEAFSGPEHGADLFYPEPEMAAGRAVLLAEHGDIPVYRVLLDQLEARLEDGRDSYEWDAQAWYGGDIDKLWLKSEGHGEFGGDIEAAEVQALWAHAVDPWFDLQLGLRQDLQPGVDRTYLVAGFQGLAPYWFEIEGAAFVSNKGDITLRFEGEYDLRLTQSLILQPRTELDFSLQDVPELDIGSGLSSASIGVRLRYELFPSSGPAVIAPYVGVQYERAFGRTADFQRADGEDVGGMSVLVGLRTWF